MAYKCPTVTEKGQVRWTRWIRSIVLLTKEADSGLQNKMWMKVRINKTTNKSAVSIVPSLDVYARGLGKWPTEYTSSSRFLILAG